MTEILLNILLLHYMRMILKSIHSSYNSIDLVNTKIRSRYSYIQLHTHPTKLKRMFVESNYNIKNKVCN